MWVIYRIKNGVKEYWYQNKCTCGGMTFWWGERKRAIEYKRRLTRDNVIDKIHICGYNQDCEVGFEEVK